MKKLIITILVFCFVQAIRALNVQLLSTDNHLSSSLVNNIYQDRHGMLWIATEDGLNRYDGVKCTIYKHRSDDSSSLASNFVLSLAEDRDGNLFVGTHAGVQLFNHASESFSPPLKNVDGSVYRGRVSSMVQRNDGEFWIFGNEVKKIVFTPSGEMRLSYPDVPNSSLLLIPFAVEDNKGNLWLAKEEDGILCINRAKQIRHFFGHSGDPSIQDIEMSTDGTVFASSARGELLRYDEKKDIFEIVARTGAFIKDIHPENDGTMLLSTDGKGLFRFDPKTEKVAEVPFGDEFLDSGIQKVHRAIRDREGNLWLAIYQKGVMLIPANPSSFGYIGRKSFKTNIIGQNCITSILRDNDGSLWVGTDNDGIYVISPDGKTSRHLDKTVPPIIIDLFGDSYGNLWVGTFTEGAGIIDRKSGTLRHIPLIEDNDRRNDADRAYKFAEDSRRNIWISTMGLGLFCYNPATGKAYDRTSILPEKALWIPAIYYSDKHDILYVGTYNGISILRNLAGDVEGEHILDGVIVNTMKEDRNGNLWIGASSGLICLNALKSETRHYTTDDGLPSNTVYAIESAGDELWISTNAGLSKFDIKDGSFANFFVNDGLQGNEFYKNASMTDADGTLWFGGVNGITFFNPAEITNSEKKRTARIADFYVRGEKVNSLSQSGGKSIIDNAVYLTDSFNLSPEDNSFSVELATRELDRHDGIIFMYSFDNEPWQTLPAGSARINFGDISYGSHTLRFKALDNGVSSEEETVSINVRYPWWLSTWGMVAYILFAIVAGCIIYLRVKAYRRNKALSEERRRAREISEAKLQFFTNIAHEIRTPISLVMSPLKKLIGSDKDPARQREYQTMNRNASRILNLINELMDLRKIDNGKMKLTFEPVAIGPYTAEVVDFFLPAAESQGIILSFENHLPNDFTVWIDPHNFDKIISNLLSNAVKYTPRNGHVQVRLEKTEPTTANSGSVILTVCDDGPGIPESERTNIFERFYKATNALTIGSGIGLHLTRTLVEMHKGTITVDKNPDAPSGACFRVSIPIGKAHVPQESESSPTTVTTGAEESSLADRRVTVDSSTAPQPDSYSGRGKQILIVEDDAEIRAYLAENFSKKYKVIQCADGTEALNMVFAKSPDLIISDIMMPGTDGLTLTRKIKQNVNLNHIPVILLTAKTEERDTLEGLDTGADAYLTKPFSIDILDRTVSNLLTGRQLLRNAFSGSQNQQEKVEDIELVSNDEKLMDRVMRVVNKNIDNPDLTVEAMASEVGMSRAHLHRKIKELTNQSPRDFVKAIRLQQAARLLREKRLTVAEVSESTGFRSPNYFSTAFKEMFGMSPTDYAQSARDDQ